VYTVSGDGVRCSFLRDKLVFSEMFHSQNIQDTFKGVPRERPTARLVQKKGLGGWLGWLRHGVRIAQYSSTSRRNLVRERHINVRQTSLGHDDLAHPLKTANDVL